MSRLPPLMRDQRKIDADHMKLLSIFHFVFGGFALLGLSLLFLHWLMMHSVFERPEMWKGQPGPPPPKEMAAVFNWFYIIFGSCIIVAAVANVVSGWLIRKRRARVFSLVVAALNCVGMPFGTILGVFSLMVLLRDSVAELYEGVSQSHPEDGPVRSPE